MPAPRRTLNHICGRQQAVEVAQYLGDENGTEVCIVSCRMPLGDDGGDAARRACFGQLAARPGAQARSRTCGRKR